jgi:hypothetical protein
MNVFYINTPVLSASGRSIGFPLECDAESVADLSEKIAVEGIVSGNQLYTTDDGRGGKLVKSRKPIALTVRGIASILPYEYEVWEPA